MYTSPELGEATNKLIAAAKKHNIILGIFLFGTSRVAEFLEKGFRFISVGNDLHHILTQAGAYVKDVEGITSQAGPWARRPSALISGRSVRARSTILPMCPLSSINWWALAASRSGNVA